MPGVSSERDRIPDTLWVCEKAKRELSGLIQIQLLSGGQAEPGRPIEPWSHCHRRGRQTQCGKGSIYLLPAWMLAVLPAQREGRRSDLRGVVQIRRYRPQNLCCHECRRPLDSGVRDVVDVTVQVAVLREILVMVPAHTGVGGPIAKRMIEKSASSGHESVEPAVLHLSV